MSSTVTAIPFARYENGHLAVRTTPMHLRWAFSNLLSADQHVIQVVFECTVEPISSETELRMLEETFLADRDSASIDDVRERFQGALADAAQRDVAKASAEECLKLKSVERLRESLLEAVRSTAFSSGLAILDPISLAIDSPSLKDQQLKALRAKSQVEHLRQLRAVFTEFEAIHRQTPGISAAATLSKLTADHQHDVLRAGFSNAKSTQKTIWITSGLELIRLCAETGRHQEGIELPTILGPIRSVQSAGTNNRLVIGARDGVFLFDPTARSVLRLYRYIGNGQTSGFNHVIVGSECVVATHAQVGVVRWVQSTEEDGKVIFSSPARHLTMTKDGHLLFSSGASLLRLKDGSVSKIDCPTTGDIVGIASCGDALLVITAIEVIRLNATTFQTITIDRRFSQIQSAAALPWMDSIRLVLATDQPGLICAGAEDALVTLYRSTSSALKSLTASPTRIAGVSLDRGRLILWNTADEDGPITEMNVAALTHHRIAGLTFA